MMNFFKSISAVTILSLFLSSCGSSISEMQPLTEKEFVNQTDSNRKVFLGNPVNERVIYDSGIITKVRNSGLQLRQSNIQKNGFKLGDYSGRIVFAFVCEGTGSITFQHSVDLTIYDASGDITDEMYEKHKSFPLSSLKSRKCGTSLEWVAKTSRFTRPIEMLSFDFFPSGEVQRFRFLVAIKD
jgi:hypothetical protein